MTVRILVGTDAGLWEINGDRSAALDAFSGRSVTAIARGGELVLLDGRTLRERRDGVWRDALSIEGPAATCMAETRAGLVIGTEQAHLLRVVDRDVARIEAFEIVAGRETWYTPWGDPADVRSIAVGADASIYVNVHVGGVVRSTDAGQSWSPTVDVEADVHQVLTHPLRANVVLAAAAVGLGVSRDGGTSWEFVTAGLHDRYLRAVALSGDMLFVSASTGHRGRRAALYRKPLDTADPFERCRDGLPEWFNDNIDTACLAGDDSVVVFGTRDGRVFRSLDTGRHWELVAKGLPPVTSVALR